MDNCDINSPEARRLTFDQLSRAIRTAGTPPTLLVLNACDTVEGAGELLLHSVPVIVAMASSVLDEAAAAFAARFYAGIAAGLTVQKAFDQGVFGVEFVGLSDEGWMITLLHREGTDPGEVVLVRPPPDSMAS